MQVTLQEMKAAFTEWDRQYREDPEEFMDCASHLLKETPETYGDACVPFFVKLIKDLRKKN